MSLYVITANLLRDGYVVFLAKGGRWTPRIEEAEVASGEDAVRRLEETARAAVTANRVVAPYLVEVETGQHGPRPVRYRERLRTLGPSVRPDVGYQAAPFGARLAVA